jgi:hypothetical protein
MKENDVDVFVTVLSCIVLAALGLLELLRWRGRRDADSPAVLRIWSGGPGPSVPALWVALSISVRLWFVMRELGRREAEAGRLRAARHARKLRRSCGSGGAE